MDLSVVLLISIAFFAIAFLYSSVGHGGASGYLAVLSFIAMQPYEMSTTALILNICVAMIAAIAFSQAGHVSMRLTLPFVLTSVPAAFLGGALPVPRQIYGFFLATVLILSSVRLLLRFETPSADAQRENHPSLIVSLFVGGIIGIVSGIVGVGGGIFLSPLIILARWGSAKQAAATSAIFIVANSVAALLGRAVQQTLGVGELLPFLIAAVLGGYAGSRYGAQRFSNLFLRRLLAIVLLLAAARLFLTSL